MVAPRNALPRLPGRTASNPTNLSHSMHLARRSPTRLHNSTVCAPGSVAVRRQRARTGQRRARGGRRQVCAPPWRAAAPATQPDMRSHWSAPCATMLRSPADHYSRYGQDMGLGSEPESGVMLGNACALLASGMRLRFRAPFRTQRFTLCCFLFLKPCALCWACKLADRCTANESKK
jgi:hypothetical protein